MYCPTDEWHRAYEADNVAINLIGYQFLPGRDSAGWPDYNSHGLGEWVYRKKMGGSYRRAPVMIDKIQAVGSSPTGPLAWSGPTGSGTASFPFANHRDGKGASIGGKFMYEDSSVHWRRFVLGKYKTIYQMAAIPGLLLHYDYYWFFGVQSELLHVNMHNFGMFFFVMPLP